MVLLEAESRLQLPLDQHSADSSASQLGNQILFSRMGLLLFDAQAATGQKHNIACTRGGSRWKGIGLPCIAAGNQQMG